MKGGKLKKILSNKKIDRGGGKLLHNSSTYLPQFLVFIFVKKERLYGI